MHLFLWEVIIETQIYSCRDVGKVCLMCDAYIKSIGLRTFVNVSNGRSVDR